MTNLASLSPKETGSTSFYKKTLSFRWVINDAANSLTFWELRSPDFSVLLQPATIYQPTWNSVWHLSLCNKTIHLCQGGNIHNYTERRHRRSIDSRTVSIRNCRFYILNPETQKTFYPKDHDERKRMFTIQINNDEPMRCMQNYQPIESSLSDYFYKDTLTIQVGADLFFVSDTGFAIPAHDQCEGAYTLYKSEVLIDTIIKCQGMEFKVHRVILASQSPVFRAMFEADMKEKQSGVIEVSDITPEAMSDLVTYLYTGTAPNLKTLASELLEVAEKYQLPHLLTKCENELGSKMKEASVIGTLILADLHGRECLKKACLEYIRLNSARVFETSEWADFRDHKNQYSQLYLEVLEYTLSISS